MRGGTPTAKSYGASLQKNQKRILEIRSIAADTEDRAANGSQEISGEQGILSE